MSFKISRSGNGMISRRALVIGFCSLMLSAGPVTMSAHADQATRAFVDKVAKDMVRIAKSGGSRAQFGRVLDQSFAVNFFANDALAYNKITVPPQHRAEYVASIRHYLSRKLEELTGRLGRGEVAIGKTTATTAQVKFPGRGGITLTTKWTLAGSGSAKKVTDIRVLHVSLRKAARNKVRKVLRRTNGDIPQMVSVLQ